MMLKSAFCTTFMQNQAKRMACMVCLNCKHSIVSTKPNAGLYEQNEWLLDFEHNFRGLDCVMMEIQDGAYVFPAIIDTGCELRKRMD